MIEQARAGRVIALTEQALPTPATIAAGLEVLIGDPPRAPVDPTAFESLSARASTRALAEALDKAYARSRA
jgi:hypothetical protein